MSNLTIKEKIDIINNSSDLRDVQYQAAMPSVWNDENIFYWVVSYSWKNYKMVYTDILKLQDQEINIWYDYGNPAGSDYREYYENKLKKFHCLGAICYVTKEFLTSIECQKELELMFNKYYDKNIVLIIGDIEYNFENIEQILKHYNQTLLTQKRFDTVLQLRYTDPINLKKDKLNFCKKPCIYDVEVDKYKNKPYGIVARIKDTEIINAIIPEKTVSAYMEEITITEIESCIFANCKYLETVELSSSIEVIGGYAFANCTNLSDIVLPKNINYLGESAFYNCKNLQQIKLPKSLLKIEPMTFAWCTSLYDVKLGSFTEEISNGAFSHCSMEKITLPNTIKKIGENAFSFCEKLVGINLPANIKYLRYGTFSFCTKLKRIKIPASIQKIQYKAGRKDGCFDACTLLTNIKVDENNKVYSDSNGVLCNKELTEMYVFPLNKKKWEIPNTIKEIPDNFFEGSMLTNITISDSIKTIGNAAFAFCSNLKKITIPKSVKHIGPYTFEGCDNLSVINYNGTCSEWNEIYKPFEIASIGGVKTDEIICIDGIVKIEHPINDFLDYLFE